MSAIEGGADDSEALFNYLVSDRGPTLPAWRPFLHTKNPAVAGVQPRAK